MNNRRGGPPTALPRRSLPIRSRSAWWIWGKADGAPRSIFVTRSTRASYGLWLSRRRAPRRGNAFAFCGLTAKNWVAESLLGLKPITAGRFVVHGAHDCARASRNRIGVEIEAAQAFGTGHHGSTRGCLLALDRLCKSAKARRILDLGTGSG